MAVQAQDAASNGTCPPCRERDAFRPQEVLSSGRARVLLFSQRRARLPMHTKHIPYPVAFSRKSWSRSFVRSIAPRRHLRVLPTRTRPSLFGSD
jgi:hypothetical protein